jgi:hypothetical protein
LCQVRSLGLLRCNKQLYHHHQITKLSHSINAIKQLYVLVMGSSVYACRTCA